MLRKEIAQLCHLSHIEQINDWWGSGSYIGPAEVVERRYYMADVKRHPYMLTSKASGPNGLIRPGTVVELAPHEVGPHHAMVPGYEYPPEAEPPAAMRHHQPMLVDMESRFETMLKKLEELEKRVMALEDKGAPPKK